MSEPRAVAGGEPTPPSEQEWSARVIDAVFNDPENLDVILCDHDHEVRARVVAAVEALHRPGNRNPECCTNCGLRWPCPTVRAARSATGGDDMTQREPTRPSEQEWVERFGHACVLASADSNSIVWREQLLPLIERERADAKLVALADIAADLELNAETIAGLWMTVVYGGDEEIPERWTAAWDFGYKLIKETETQ